MWALPLLYIHNKGGTDFFFLKLSERFFYFYFHSLLSSIYGNRIVGIRRGKNEKALPDEGYAWEQKTRDFIEFSIKIRKILCFGFS